MLNPKWQQRSAQTQYSLLQFAILALAYFPAVLCKTDVELDKYGTNHGPLTTTFNPNGSCFTETRTVHGLSWGWYPNLEIGCLGPGGDDCCPDGWARGRYFSPGMCPSGYSACTLPTTRQREETTNLCCPENWYCPTAIDYGYDLCSSSLNDPVTETYTREGESTSYIETFGEVSATPFQIRFKATDSSVVPVPTGSFSLPPPGSDSDGLSRAAKIGIGVGVGIPVLALLACCLCCWTRSRQKKEKAESGHMLLNDLGSTVAAEGGAEQGSAEESPPPYSKK